MPTILILSGPAARVKQWRGATLATARNAGSTPRIYFPRIGSTPAAGLSASLMRVPLGLLDFCQTSRTEVHMPRIGLAVILVRSGSCAHRTPAQMVGRKENSDERS